MDSRQGNTGDGFWKDSSDHLQSRPQEYIESSDIEYMKPDITIFIYTVLYRGAATSLARPGNKLGSMSGTRAISTTSRRELS